MLGYDLWLAWRSVRRNPVLTALIVAGIALGVGVSTTFIAVYHLLAQDPLPHKSDRLFYVRMDSWDPHSPHPHPSAIPPQMTYRDVRAVMRSDIPRRQTASFFARLFVYPESARQRPSRETVRLTFGDFFPMFDVPFRYGAGWGRAADERPEPVAVLSADLNDRLFGGADSVGRRLRVADREFTVVGVLAPWRPRVRFYDMTGMAIAQPEDLYLPFNWVEPMEIRSGGNRDNWTTVPGDDSDSFAERLNATESTWVQLWVELDSPARRAEYEDFLDAYALDQKRLGRFQRPLDNRATSLTELIDEWNIVPPQARALAVISILFLIVASLNLIGLFMGKFLARAPVVGVRRALGATRAAIFREHLIECEVVGLAGGVIGLLLSMGILVLLSRGMASLVAADRYFRLDPPMIAAGVLLSLVAGAIAGVYPSWRVCSLPPAEHLKAQ
jgi:putative ABC transport system permease protein